MEHASYASAEHLSIDMLSKWDGDNETALATLSTLQKDSFLELAAISSNRPMPIEVNLVFFLFNVVYLLHLFSKSLLQIAFMVYTNYVQIMNIVYKTHLLFFYIPFIVNRGRKETEAQYIGKAITPTCFRKGQDIAVRLKFFILVF